jgi:hypothetical protein
VKDEKKMNEKNQDVATKKAFFSCKMEPDFEPSAETQKRNDCIRS